METRSHTERVAAELIKAAKANKATVTYVIEVTTKMGGELPDSIKVFEKKRLS